MLSFVLPAIRRNLYSGCFHICAEQSGHNKKAYPVLPIHFSRAAPSQSSSEHRSDSWIDSTLPDTIEIRVPYSFLQVVTWYYTDIAAGCSYLTLDFWRLLYLRLPRRRAFLLSSMPRFVNLPSCWRPVLRGDEAFPSVVGQRSNLRHCNP